MAGPIADELMDLAEEAIRNRLAEEGLMMTGLLGLTLFIDEEGKQNWALLVNDNQSLVTSLGMQEILSTALQVALGAHFCE